MIRKRGSNTFPQQMCSVEEISPQKSIEPVKVASTDICALLGERVRALRRSRSWRQDDLAQHAGLTRTYISNLEKGKKNPSLRTLEILAVALDKTPAELLSGL